MRALLIAAIAAAAILVLAAVGPLFIPTSAYRGWIEEEIAAHLDARVQFKKFRFQLLPYPGYTITDLGLVSTRAPFQGLPLLTAEKIRGSLSFWNLIAGKIATSITAHGVTLDYRVAGEDSNLGAMAGISAAEPSALIPPVPAPQGTPGVPGAIPPPGGPEIRALAPAEPSAPPSGISPGAPPVTVPPAMPPVPQTETPPKGPTTPPPTPTPIGPTPVPNEPSAFDLIRRAIVGEARAGQPPSAAADDALSIRSVRVSKGRFNYWKDGTVVFALEGIDLEAQHLSFASGVGADIRMGAMAAGVNRFPVSVSGQLFVDTPRRELGARGVRGTIAGAQAVVDFSVNYGAAPLSFDIHAATPDMGARAAAALLGMIGGHFPTGLAWDGPLAADLSLRGTRQSCALSAQVEAASARFAIGGWWAKGAGLPFKISLDAAISPQVVSLQQATVTLGQQALNVKGQIDTAEGIPFQVGVSGTGLDGNALKVFFPHLSLLDALDGADVTLNISGAVLGDAPTRVGGQFKAKRVAFAGLELTDPEGTFERGGVNSPPPAPAAEAAPPLAEGSEEAKPAPEPPTPVPTDSPDAIVIPTLKGTFAGGTLTGNGQLTLTQPMEFSFDGVVERLEASAIPALEGAMSGEASLVVKATSNGQDASALSSRMKLAGSLLVKSGAWKEARLPPQLFSADLWGEIESAAQTKLDAPAEETLAQTGNEFIDLSASFEMTPGTIALSDLSWDQSSFDAKLKAEVGPDHAVKGEGTVTLSKVSAQALVSQPAARNALLSSEGRFAIPVKIGGKLPAFEIAFEREKVAAMVKERMAAAPPMKAGKAPAKAAAREKAQAPPAPGAAAPQQKPPEAAAKRPAAAPAKKAEGALAPPPEKPASRGKRSAPPSDEQVDDMLKVIIGQ